MLSDIESNEIIRIGEESALLQHGWTTARHKYYPTTDISVYSINNTIQCNALFTESPFPDGLGLRLNEYNQEEIKNAQTYHDSMRVATSDKSNHRKPSFFSSSSSAYSLQPCQVWINETLIKGRIFPLLSSQYHIPSHYFSMKDLFIVKYDATDDGKRSNRQRRLVMHQGSSQLSFNLALSKPGVDYQEG